MWIASVPPSVPRVVTRKNIWPVRGCLCSSGLKTKVESRWAYSCDCALQDNSRAARGRPDLAFCCQPRTDCGAEPFSRRWPQADAGPRRNHSAGQSSGATESGKFPALLAVGVSTSRQISKCCDMPCRWWEWTLISPAAGAARARTPSAKLYMGIVARIDQSDIRDSRSTSAQREKSEKAGSGFRFRSTRLQHRPLQRRCLQFDVASLALAT